MQQKIKMIVQRHPIYLNRGRTNINRKNFSSHLLRSIMDPLQRIVWSRTFGEIYCTSAVSLGSVAPLDVISGAQSKFLSDTGLRMAWMDSLIPIGKGV
jgi:hypothetical protein